MTGVSAIRTRRIKLARKTIRCSRKLTKETVIAEVEHLHRLQHAHILRVVGTYTLKKNLAILLYPATPWNLEEFMEEMLDTQSTIIVVEKLHSVVPEMVRVSVGS
ncbi:hypothetical protein T440DRAFT_176120 [Plenodomus tracheiphilus IPT5]|uniref:Protein kinase domain-containing protein n=1 Tax=Plenodomus tracheiphilus IPT5 TaxID=1408161 RepID=A0A6A7B0Z7_9PLEO|nr:hypothetical protein T440DRAFT_176120 [Plenodomus tracheiphilus IPT5]